MLRGHRSIFTSLFQDEQPDVVTTPERKGRSEALIIKRNELLICRYYFYIKINAYQYQVTLAILEEEFFVAERTIIDILSRNNGILKKLHQTKPTARYFKDRYPRLVWA